MRASGTRWSDERLRDELLRRYASAGASGMRLRLKYEAKRLAWKAVVASARILKRALDVAASGVLLVLLAPAFAAVALLVRLDSKGPVLFRQTRVGKWGRLFTMWKFRTMYLDAEARKAALEEHNQMGRVTFKMKRDPRITHVGRYLRKGSLDELPQLWNVLVGDMSLVGPRPPVPKEVALYSLADRRRLEAEPGITCIWQVSGRSDIPFDRQVALDVEYIESQSIWVDLGLLLRTIPAVLLGKGAY